VGAVVGGLLGGSSSSADANRPVSKFGIPTYIDEGCVICQYLVERIQDQIAHSLLSADEGGMPDPNKKLTDKEMRTINARLMTKRGGKGLMRIIAEDTLIDLCNSERMPELFYSYCSVFKTNMPVILDGVYYQFHAQAVCQDASFCPMFSYFYMPTAVHEPVNSKIFNSGRGPCGLKGGIHQRSGGLLSSALCFASKGITH